MEYEYWNQQTIIATGFDEPGHRFCMGIVVASVDDVDDVVTAIQDATLEYLETDEGKAVLQANKGHFNYGDFLENVPDELCVKHGFHLMDVFETDLIVDHNKNLAE